MKDFRHIIKRPLNTEKSSNQREDLHQYSFEVDRRANKIEIKKAVEALFDVEVVKVRTLKVHGKPKQMRPYPAGKRPDWKKAIVTVKEGNQIGIFHEV